MSTLGWLAIAAYATTYVYGFRWNLRAWTADLPIDDASDFAFVLFLAFFFGLFGPFILLRTLYMRACEGRDLERAVRVLSGESREDKITRLERERAEREDYIARLERDLEIG